MPIRKKHVAKLLQREQEQAEMLPRLGCWGRGPAWIGLLGDQWLWGCQVWELPWIFMCIQKKRGRSRSFQLLELHDYVKSGLVPVQPKTLQVQNKRAKGITEAPQVFTRRTDQMCHFWIRNMQQPCLKDSVFHYGLVLDKHKSWAHKRYFRS